MAPPNTASTSIIDRIQCSDPSLTKLKLVKPPSDYYVDFEDFVSALQQNSSIDYVLLEGGYLRYITDEVYTELLHAVARMQNLLELEIWGERVPLASVCLALAEHHTIQKFGVGFARLSEWSDCSALSEHPSLKTVYLSHFHFTTDPQGTEPVVRTGLDSLLTALSTCPALC